MPRAKKAGRNGAGRKGVGKKRPAGRNEAVLELMQKEITANPAISNADLQEKAAALDGSLAKLDKRRFHASYALPVRRRLSPKKKAAKRAARNSSPSRAPRSRAESASNGDRDRLRGVLLDLAMKAATAKDNILSLLSNIDAYADRVLAAVKR